MPDADRSPSRPTLDPGRVEAAVRDLAGDRWRVEVLASSPSTNAVASVGAYDGRVVVADHQTAGRGRLDRVWTTPAGAALTVSVVVDPGVPDHRWPLLPLVAGLAVVEGVRACTPVAATLKWPNDVLVADRKLAGILVERVAGPGGQGGQGGPVAVVGVGLNVDLADEELPVPTATSLRVEHPDAVPERGDLLAATLAALGAGLAELARSPSSLLDRYRDACSTLHREVDVHLPGGAVVRGRAVAVSDDGRLRVRVDGADDLVVGAGDVVHVRAV